MKIKLIFAVTVMALFSVGARGVDFTNARELHDYCQLSDKAAPTALDSFNMGQCLGFMSGWLQGTSKLMIVVDEKSYVISFADGLTVGQMSRVFVLYVEKHPEYDNKSGDYVLTRAMGDAKLLILTPQKSATPASMVQ